MEAYNTLKQFQLGGAINITDQKKKELFPYFAYLYTQKMLPDKYGQVESLEEWTALIQDSPEDVEVITQAATELTNDDWSALAQQYEQADMASSETTTAEERGVALAAKGAKLKKLAAVKKGTNTFAKIDTKEKTIKGVSKKQTGGDVHIPTLGQLNKIQKANTGIQSKQPGGKVATAIKVEKKKELPDALKPKPTSPPKKGEKSKTELDKLRESTKKKEGLKMLKDGAKVKKKKKCSCGCDMILTKAAGGKVMEMCSCKCGGKMKKKK